MGRQIIGLTLFGLGAGLLGYGIGCLTTRDRFVMALAKAVVDKSEEQKEVPQE